MVIPTHRLPHLAPLVRDYFYDFAKVREFYNGDFRDPAAFERQAERVQSRSLPRRELAAILTEQNTNYGGGPITLGHIEKIARDRAGAVVTGQQVGLFSGPLYTIYKALTAVKLAADLGRRGLGNFVPVFWLASDDHDLAEIDHIAHLDKDNRLEEVRCPAPPVEGRIPASNLVLPPEIVDCVRKLDASTPDTEFKAEVISRLSEAYAPGRTYVEAFARWLTRLFGSRGLILIDAADPRLKAMGREVFEREIREDSSSTRLAVAASDRLLQAGYGAQVPLHDGILNVFYTDRERRTIHRRDGVLSIMGSAVSIPKDELLSRAKEDPSAFSPNVLLRPVYQDALLPTVAYVGGHAEVAYFAQLRDVFEAFGLPMPIVYPRLSVTVLERHIARVLTKYGLEIPGLWTQPDGLIADLARKQVPETLEKAVSGLHAGLEERFASLKTEAVAFEPALQASLDLVRGKLDRQLSHLEKKIRQAAVGKNETAVRQVRKAAANLFPGRRLQERVFNIVPYLIKYGYAFLDRLDRDVDIGEHDHQVLQI